MVTVMVGERPSLPTPLPHGGRGERFLTTFLSGGGCDGLGEVGGEPIGSVAEFSGFDPVTDLVVAGGQISASGEEGGATRASTGDRDHLIDCPVSPKEARVGDGFRG